MAAELLPQVADVHVERTIEFRRPAPVQGGRELVTRDDSTRGVNQEFENVIFDGGHRDRGPVGRDLACRGDELDSSGLEDLGFLGGPDRAAEHGPDPGHQLFRPERLGQIIVGPRVQTGHAVCLGRAGRQHDHRDLALAPDQSEQLETVEPRHHHVQEQQVVLSAQGTGQSPAPVVHGLEPNIPAGEKLLEELAQFDVVVHEQDRHARLTVDLPRGLAELPRSSPVPSYFPGRSAARDLRAPAATIVAAGDSFPE